MTTLEHIARQRTEAVNSIYQSTEDMHRQSTEMQASAHTSREEGHTDRADQAEALAKRMRGQVAKGCKLLQDAGSTMPPACNDIAERARKPRETPTR